MNKISPNVKIFWPKQRAEVSHLNTISDGIKSTFGASGKLIYVKTLQTAFIDERLYFTEQEMR